MQNEEDLYRFIWLPLLITVYGHVNLPFFRSFNPDFWVLKKVIFENVKMFGQTEEKFEFHKNCGYRN